MSKLARQLDRPATYQDLEELPPSLKGEIIDGVLYTQPRPRPRHSLASAAIGSRVFGKYHDGAGGPGGWWILTEPGIELPDSPEVAPDLAGWRRERLPRLPADEPIRLAPDWICEILSPSNRAYDRTVKFPFHARVGVAHLWVVDPEARTVEVKQLVAGRWSDIAAFSDDDLLVAPPFLELEIPLGSLWL